MGKVSVRGEKIYTLTYADDMVVMAEEEAKLRSMIKRLERYLDKKKLEVNVEKTKIM